MYGNKGKQGGGGPSADAQAREKLTMYVYEYLLQSGAPKAAHSFLSEIQWDKNIPPIADPPGFLQSWWGVFWDLYAAAPERRDIHEHSNEAKAFHDYGMANQLAYGTGNGIQPNASPSPISSLPPQDMNAGGSMHPHGAPSNYYPGFSPRFSSPRMRMPNDFNNPNGPMPMHSGMSDLRGSSGHMSPSIRQPSRMSFTLPQQHQYPLRGPHLPNGMNHNGPAAPMSHMPPMSMPVAASNRQWAPPSSNQQMSYNPASPNSFSAHPGVGTPGTPIMSSPHDVAHGYIPGSTSSQNEVKPKDSAHSSEMYNNMMSRAPMPGNFGPVDHMMPGNMSLEMNHHPGSLANGSSPGNIVDGIKSSPAGSNCAAPQTPLRGEDNSAMTNDMSGNNHYSMQAQFHQSLGEPEADAKKKIYESLQAEAKLFEKDDVPGQQVQQEFF